MPNLSQELNASSQADLLFDSDIRAYVTFSLLARVVDVLDIIAQFKVGSFLLHSVFMLMYKTMWEVEVK